MIQINPTLKAKQLMWYRPARKLAMQALYQHDFCDSSANDLCSDYLLRFSGDTDQDKYFCALMLGVADAASALDNRFAGILDRPVSRLDLLDKVLLRIGVWELTESTHIPPHKIITENVRLASVFCGEGSHKYINAILDNIAGCSERQNHQSHDK